MRLSLKRFREKRRGVTPLHPTGFGSARAARSRGAGEARRGLLILLLLLCVLCVSARDPAFAQTGSHSTGLGWLTASQSIYQGQCVLTQLKVQTDGVHNATVVLYNNTSAAGEVITSWTCPGPGVNGATNTCEEDWPCPNREISTGIYATISGTGAQYIVEWRTR